MGFTITKTKPGPTGAQITVDRRLYLTADRSRLVEADDPEARFLFCSEGKRVSREQLLQLGVEIVNPDEAAAAEAAVPATLEDLNVEGEGGLKELLRAHDLKVTGRKSDLIARLEDAGIGIDGAKGGDSEPNDGAPGRKEDDDGTANKEDADGDDKGAGGDDDDD